MRDLALPLLSVNRGQASQKQDRGSSIDQVAGAVDDERYTEGEGQMVRMLGTWKVHITAVQDGATQGQTVEGKIVFMPDSHQTCLSLAPNTGSGSWEQNAQSSNEFFFAFTEVVYDAHGNFTNYACVSQHARLSSDGQTFTSSGTGSVYRADGTLLVTTPTRVQATRI